MSRTRRSSRRAAAAIGAALLFVVAATATTPAVPRVSAVDASPDPSASVSPDPGPTPTVPPDPTPAPTPDPTPDPAATPTPDPTSDPSATAEVTPSPAPTDAVPSVEPTVDPSVEPSVDPSADPSAEPSLEPSPSPTPSPEPTPAIEVAHSWVDKVDAAGDVVQAGATDGDLARMERFVVYRIRFQVLNSGNAPVELTPILEAGTGADPGTWAAVPEVDPAPGQPFYAASDDGAVFRVRSTVVPPFALRLGDGPAPDFRAVAGVASAGLNPAPAITLPPRTFTEVEFAVRATVNAAWTQSYAFRLQPAAVTVAAGAPVVVTMRSRPPVVLTMPTAATTLSPASPGVPRYELAVARTSPAGPAYPLAALVDPDSPHVESSLTSDSCAACHAPHRAPSDPLLDATYRVDPLRSATEPYQGTDFALCLECHQEAPFADTSGSPSTLTSFPGHGFHMGLIEENGTGGLDITTPGDGQGNALCAECHYNLHAVPSSQRGLVLFAPDVVPYDGTDAAHVGELVYDPATQSCTLTCHGKAHDGLTFQATQPGT
jgi:hypothetical protein